MSILLAIIATLAGILAPAFFVVVLYDYFAYRSLTKEYPVIKFKSFIAFYDINPDRWKLHDYLVECILKSSYSGICQTTETFCFNYIDANRYKHWLKHLSKYKQSQSNSQKTARMIAAVKEDIAQTEALAQQRQNEAINILRSMHNI